MDCDTFDNELAALRAMIGNMDEGKGASLPTSTLPPPRPAGPQLSTKDLNRIKEILEKFPGVEETQQKILKDLKGLNLQQIRDQIDQLMKLLSKYALVDDLKKLDTTVQGIS